MNRAVGGWPGLSHRPTTRTLTAAAPARRNVNAADWALDPVVHTSSNTNTCLPAATPCRLQHELVRAHHPVAHRRGRRHQRGLPHRLHRPRDLRERMHTGPAGQRRNDDPQRDFHPDHRCDASLMRRNAQPQKRTDDHAALLPHRAHRVVLVVAQQRGRFGGADRIRQRRHHVGQTGDALMLAAPPTQLEPVHRGGAHPAGDRRLADHVAQVSASAPTSVGTTRVASGAAPQRPATTSWSRSGADIDITHHRRRRTQHLGNTSRHVNTGAAAQFACPTASSRPPAR